MITTCPEGLIK